MVGDISWPEHVAIHTVPFQVAVDTRIPLILYGEHSPTEYGGPQDVYENRRMTRRWAAEYAGYLGLRVSDLIGTEGLTKRDMSDYECPNDQYLEKIGVEAHFLGQYIEWDSHRNSRVAIDHGMQYQLPCKANWWNAENQDNAQTGIHDYFGYLKYGYGRGCAQISVDIRNELISREDALKWVEKHDGLFPDKYMGVSLEEILDRIDVTRDEFDEYCKIYEG
jgi:hypothetical protein